MTLVVNANPAMDDGVYQFAATPANRQRLYVARVSGLYYSDDLGGSWESAYESLNLPAALATLAVVAPPAPKKAALFAGINGGLLHSPDGGGHWQSLRFADPQPAVAALAASPTYMEDGCLFAGTLEDGLLYSTDFGSHWQTGNLGLIDLHTLCLAVSPDFKEDQTVWLGTQTGLFCSHTGGRAWREVPLPTGYETILSLAVSADADRQVYTLWAGTETAGLWRSADRGHDWVRLGAKELTGAINQIVWEPGSQTLVVVCEGELWRNARAGDHWQRVKAPDLKEGSVTAVTLAPDAAGRMGLLVGLEGGQTSWVRL